MKTATKRRSKRRRNLEEEYRRRLVNTPGAGRGRAGRAYELGRRAITEKKSFMENRIHASSGHPGMLAEGHKERRGTRNC